MSGCPMREAELLIVCPAGQDMLPLAGQALRSGPLPFARALALLSQPLPRPEQGHIADCRTVPLPLAAMLGMLAEEALWRVTREGVLLLHADADMLHAALAFGDSFYAFAALPATPVLENEGEILKALLDDFRLGWLPPEALAQYGGSACCVASLPSEAEGFRPAFASGSAAARVSGQARVLADAESTPGLICRGTARFYPGE